MNQRKRLVIATLFICLYPALPLLFGAISFVTVPSQANETSLNQTSAFVGTLYNILGYLTILSYILLIAGIVLIVSVIRSMPKTKVETPIPEPIVPKPQVNVVKPAVEQKPRSSVWATLNKEIGSKKPVPKPVREPNVITCPDCHHKYYFRVGMVCCPWCKHSF